MDDLTSFIVIAGIVILAVAVGYARNQTNKQRIHEYLSAKGATDVVISKAWFTHDRDTNTYDVEYTDRQGRYCRNRCKVRSSWFARDDAIYWRDPV